MQEQQPDHEDHGRELLAERVLEPQIELVLQPLRERRELVAVLERDDDRRVGRRRLVAHVLLVPALDVLDRHRHADRHRLVTRRRCTRLDAARLLLDRHVSLPAIVVWPRPIENRIADRPPRWMTHVDEVRVGDRHAVRLRELAVVELDHRRRHHDRHAVLAASARCRRSSSAPASGTGCSTRPCLGLGERRPAAARSRLRATALPAARPALPRTALPRRLPATGIRDLRCGARRGPCDPRRAGVAAQPRRRSVCLSWRRRRRLDDVLARVARRRHARDAVRIVRRRRPSP